jgi:hypothetical protein
MAVTKLSNSGIKTGILKYDSMLAGNAAYDPAATWLIQRIAGTGSSGTITFSNIPQTYTSLQVRFIGRSTGGTDSTFMTLQYNSTAMTAAHYLRGNGSTATAAASNFPIYIPCTNVTSGVMGVGIIDIQDYANTSRNKTARYFGGWDGNGVYTTNERLQLASSFLDNTSAITSISLVIGTGSWSTNSSFALYGFKGA